MDKDYYHLKHRMYELGYYELSHEVREAERKLDDCEWSDRDDLEAFVREGKNEIQYRNENNEE